MSMNNGKSHRQLSVFSLLLCVHLTVAAESQCFGSVSRGRIDASVQLPQVGPNFAAYSAAGVALGRTHVHSKVANIVLAAYAAAAVIAPTVTYVYGETGWPKGGRIRPHRTHQNGLSVDFFVPVRNAQGQSVPLPSSLTNRFGYDIEFDQKGQYGAYTIDFTAFAEHLYQLHVAAAQQQVKLALVIIDPLWIAPLWATPRGAYLRAQLPLMKGKPWVRHDEHYHVDFAVPCGKY